MTRLTTRYFGGYEGVRILQVHDTYYVVSRFGGQVSDILPKECVAKIFDDDGTELFCNESEKGIHPEARALLSRLTQTQDGGRALSATKKEEGDDR